MTPSSCVDKLEIKDNKKKEDMLTGISKASKDLFDEFKKEVNEYKRDRHINPIVNIVAILPKDELAAMAESLVNLTSFKRKISMQAETVGGPIDVAVISKGDGFVWIKRKRYFKPELNPHFFANYYKDMESDGYGEKSKKR